MTFNRTSRRHFTDMLGAEVKVKDFIVYGHVYSYGAGIQVGQVYAIEIEENNSRTICKWRISIRGATSDWQGVRLKKRRGSIAHPGRTVRVTDVIPNHIKELFNK